MTQEFKNWWLHYVEKNTPEGYFYLPLEAKNINDMTPEEFDLLDASEWELKDDNSYGIVWFLCKIDKSKKK